MRGELQSEVPSTRVLRLPVDTDIQASGNYGWAQCRDPADVAVLAGSPVV